MMLFFVFTVLPPKDPMAIERSNLLSMMKLSIKVLIQSSMSLGRTLDSDYPPLQQFFVVLEHCLKHGLKGKTFKNETHLVLKNQNKETEQCVLFYFPSQKDFHWSEQVHMGSAGAG